MPKNQFTQADFEESVKQRWNGYYVYNSQAVDGSKVAIKLIDWNKDINKEVEEKQKQEQKELEQQKLKDLKQEQQKASSSSAGPEQSPKKETGAIPKQRKNNEGEDLRKQEENKKKYKEYRKQKGKEQQERDKQVYSNFKGVLERCFEVMAVFMIGSLLTDVKKTRDIENKLYEADDVYQNEHIYCYEKSRFCIKGYITALIYRKLLSKDCIDISYKKLPLGSQKELISNTEAYKLKFALNFIAKLPSKSIYKETKKNNIKKAFQDEFYGPMRTELSKYGVKIPDIRYSDIPDIENIEKVESDLKSEINTLVRKNDFYSKEGTVMPWDILYDRRNFTGIYEFLDNIMKKNNYSIDVDALVRKYQPNSSVQEASTKLSSTQKITAKLSKK